MDIIIKISKLKIECSLKDNLTAKTIFQLLPIKSKINTWGDEIYFDIPKIISNLKKTLKKSLILEKLPFGTTEVLLRLVLDQHQQVKMMKSGLFRQQIIGRTLKNRMN